MTAAKPIEDLARPRLRHSFAWMLAGNVVYAGCQWGMLVALAKLGGAQALGRFAFGLAVSAPIFMLANLQVRAIQATDARGERRFGEYLGLRLATTLAALLAVLVAAAAQGGAEAAAVVAAVGAAKAFESISDIFHGELQRRERMDRIAGWLMLKGVLSLAALAAVLGISGRTSYAAASMATVWALVLVCGEMRSVTVPRGPLWDRRALLRLARTAWPLGVVMMLISLNANIPRYFVKQCLGESGLGIFAGLGYIAIAGNTVVSALGQAATPRLASLYMDGAAAAFAALLRKMLLLGALLGAAGVAALAFAGKPLLTMLYRAEFALHLDAAIWIMLAAGVGFAASFLGYGMTAARCFDVQAPLFAAVTAVTVLSAAWLIPAYGLRGAAWTTVATACAQLAGSAALLSYGMRRLRAAEVTP